LALYLICRVLANAHPHGLDCAGTNEQVVVLHLEYLLTHAAGLGKTATHVVAMARLFVKGKVKLAAESPV